MSDQDERIEEQKRRARSHDADRPSERIRRDIERTRYEMDQTMDALERRLGPRGVVSRVSGAFEGDGGDGFVRELRRQLRDHPVPVALMGLGLGWLAVESTVGGSTGPDLSASSGGGDSGSAGERARGAARSAGETGKRAAERARERVRSTTNAVSDATRRAREELASTGESATHRIGTMLDERPLVLGALTLGLGLAAGLSAPSSRWEDEAVGETADTVKEEADALASEARERGEEAAAAAAETATRGREDEG